MQRCRWRQRHMASQQQLCGFFHADRLEAALMILEWLRSPQQMEQAAMAARSRFLSRFQSQEAAIRLAEFITSVGAQP